MTTARALPVELKAKLAPILRMLSSDNAGDRANAASAAGRLLKSHGWDWHDLVDFLLVGPPSPPPPSPPPPPPHKNGGSTWDRTDGPTQLDRDQMLELIDLIEASSPYLSIKSRDFLTSLRNKSFGRPRVHFSAKQWDWFQDLVEGI
jgi:hypothetical protein